MFGFYEIYPININTPRVIHTQLSLNMMGKVHNLNLNLNSLLAKRQIDNPSSGAVTGGNYPDSMTTLAQRWHSIAPLAYGYLLGVQCWPNVGPTMP